MKFMLFPELAQLSQALMHSSQECTVHTRIEAYSCKSVKKDKRLSKAMESSFADVKAEIKHSVGSGSPAAEDSQDEDSLYASPFGPLNKSSSRKTLYHLIALLNLAFPDYDFSEAKPDHFCREVNGSSVLQALSATMYSVRTQSGPRLVYAPRTYATYPSTSPSIGSPLSGGLPRSVGHSHSPVYVGSPAAMSPPASVISASPISRSPHTSQHHQTLSSGIHPTLFQVLDKVINLAQCDVYSYAPDMDSDPHADSDSDSSSSSSDDEDEITNPTQADYNDLLGFEDFHHTASGSPPKPSGMTIINKAPYGRWAEEDVEESGRASPNKPFRRRSGGERAGGLLWSSHWFFYNKAMKRILFVTIWAKKRRPSSDGEEDGEEVAEKVDRFTGWEGAHGAGARALGLKAKTA